ncbi:MAG TPA: HD domain-containing protein [Candidatus Choladousia intestinipullorum]|nr:HD domain-containing protein [Candidatus Choladousia intestinipullorum]
MGDEVLGRLGYTEHSRKHAAVVADRAAEILRTLDYSKREIELARITGYLHDIGNCVNRHDHAHSGAVMAFQILRDMKFQPEDIAIIVSAIGNHDEATGTAVTPVSAAVIIADKTDVRANRVRNTDIAFFDKHDRVNYAAIKTKLTTDAKKKVIHLNIKLDEQICSVLDYFEIFTDRMLMSRRAAEILGLKFKFTVNGNKVL